MGSACKHGKVYENTRWSNYDHCPATTSWLTSTPFTVHRHPQWKICKPYLACFRSSQTNLAREETDHFTGDNGSTTSRRFLAAKHVTKSERHNWCCARKTGGVAATFSSRAQVQQWKTGWIWTQPSTSVMVPLHQGWELYQWQSNKANCNHSNTGIWLKLPVCTVPHAGQIQSSWGRRWGLEFGVKPSAYKQSHLRRLTVTLKNPLHTNGHTQKPSVY